MLSDNTHEEKQKFTKDNLDNYLKELAKEFRKINGRGAAAEVILVGGAAVLAGYDFREITVDIDAIIRTNASMKSAINNVGDNFNLKNGWLNNDFVKTDSYSPKLVEHSKPYKTFGGVISVRMVSAEYLMAMKLSSFRPYKKDQSDVLGILTYHTKTGNPLPLEKIKQAAIELYGSWNAISMEAQKFIELAYSTDNLEQLYRDTVLKEEEAKRLLVDFEEQYEGVLNADNLNDVLAALRAQQSEHSHNENFSENPAENGIEGFGDDIGDDFEDI